MAPSFALPSARMQGDLDIVDPLIDEYMARIAGSPDPVEAEMRRYADERDGFHIVGPVVRRRRARRARRRHCRAPRIHARRLRIGGPGVDLAPAARRRGADLEALRWTEPPPGRSAAPPRMRGWSRRRRASSVSTSAASPGRAHSTRPGWTDGSSGG